MGVFIADKYSAIRTFGDAINSIGKVCTSPVILSYSCLLGKVSTAETNNFKLFGIELP